MEQESVTKGTGRRLTFTASVSTYVSIISSSLLIMESKMDKYILQQPIAMLRGSSFRGRNNAPSRGTNTRWEKRRYHRRYYITQRKKRCRRDVKRPLEARKMISLQTTSARSSFLFSLINSDWVQISTLPKQSTISAKH